LPARLPARDFNKLKCEDVVTNMASKPSRSSTVDDSGSFTPRELECEMKGVVTNMASKPSRSSTTDDDSGSFTPRELECEIEDVVINITEQLCKVNKEAYTPKHVSIGPIHHRRKELSGMKTHKKRYFDYFFRRPMLKKSEKDLQKIIEDNEKKIRNCYSDDCGLKSKEFVEMILLDAIFIIELFLRTREKKMDYILSKPWLRIGIQHDLILLENQLPFFVLEKLYKFVINDTSSCNHCKEGKQIVPCFVMLSCHYFSKYDRLGIGEEVTKKPINEEMKHFTDLLRYLFCSSVSKLYSTDQPPLHPRYCAKELDQAGLKFKAAKKGKLLEIQFHQNNCRCFDCSCLLACLPCFKCIPFLESTQCILEVPSFQIDDYTEVVFRNLMALEQWHYPYNAYICNYVVLLDRLINTEEDVGLLVKKEVIVNLLGSNDVVATLINQLGDQITEATSCYNDIAEKLNAHYDHLFNQILATLTREYFPNIFRGTATIVGLIVLGFTLWNFFK
jgi:hypothetical protein